MLKNYFNIGLRNLWSKKIYSGINLLGLSVAAAFCMLVFMYVQQERSFDRFHKNADRLFRLEATSLFSPGEMEQSKKLFFSFLMDKENDVKNMLTHPYVVMDDIKADFPEVDDVIRFQSAGDLVVWYNNEPFKLKYDKTTYAEKNLFTLLDFPLLYGNAANVLNEKFNVVISERTSKRLFGNENPIGKIIHYAKHDTLNYTVAGVVKNFPSNSSYDFDIIMPLEAHPSHLENMADRSNNHFNYTALLLLKKNTDVPAFNSKLKTFSKTYFADAISEWQKNEQGNRLADFHLSVRPFTAAHYNASFPWGHYTNLENMYELGVLALVVLLIACVNYVLLSLTNTVSRSQEVGIRKTMGAGRKNIVLQFLIETQMLVLFSVIAGVVICISAVPFFNSITGAHISLKEFSPVAFILGALVLFFVLGIAAGLYPALIMSGMRPINMLRKFSSVKINPVLSKGLVVAQYAACVMLIISSLVISRQMNHMNKMGLGFDKEQVLILENPYQWDDPERLTFSRRIYEYASSQPVIEGITVASSKFGGGFNMNGHLVNGKREMIFMIPVDFSYFDFYKIKLLKGRFFSRHLPTDSARFEIPDHKKAEGSSAVRRPIVVNNTLYKMLGEPPLDEINVPMGARIIGVCDDYQFFNATQKVSPAYHVAGNQFGFQYAFLKIKSGQDIPGVINRIKNDWDKLTGKQPFVFSFVDEEVKKGYEAYTKWLETINAATILAVIVACMGLFGLSALYAVNRTKEVGIRKVMGASAPGLFFLLNKGILKLVLISFVIAVPVSVYLMKSWLQNFVNRIELTWIYFAVAGMIAIVLAILSVSYHAIKSASANPVESLKTE